MDTSSIQELVGSGYRTLNGRMSSGADKSEKYFHTWASGTILLDARSTSKAMAIEDDIEILLDLINRTLVELGELRLIAVLGPLKDNRVTHVVYLLLTS